MIEKLVVAGLVVLAAIWFVGDAPSVPLPHDGPAVTAPKVEGPNYLPEPKLPDPVDGRGIIDPRDFRGNGMPYPGDPADPGHCSAPGSGLPCDPPTP